MRLTVKKFGALAVLLGTAMGSAANAAATKTAVFNVTADHRGPGVQVTINSKVWLTPTQAKAEVKHPLQGDMTLLFTNGFFYQLDPKSKRGIKGPLPPEMKKSKDNFSLLMGLIAFDAAAALQKAKKVGTETVSGYACDVLTSTATQGEATRSIKVWMPQKMDPKFPVKAVMTDNINKPGASMNQTATITLSNIKLNGTIPAATFAVPKGYKIMSGAPKAPPPGKK